jgi:hypothetical protein
MTLTLQESTPLDTNGTSVSTAGAQVLNKGQSSSLPDVDVSQIWL